MNTNPASMAVIGAGSYGTALAITLARNGHQVVLWGHDLNIFNSCNKTAVTALSYLMLLSPIRCDWKPT